MSATVTRIDRTSSGQDLPQAPTSAVVRREDVEAWRSGFAFMKAAEARAGTIEETVRDAHQAAHKAGYAEGYRAGLSKGQEDISGQVSKYLSTIEGQIVGTVMDIVRSMLGKVPDCDLVINACKQAMGRLHGAATLVVKVHPDVAMDVGTALQELAEPGSKLRVEVDPGLPSPKSLVLQTPRAVVSAGIEEQLAELERAMRASPRKTTGQPILHKPPEMRA